MTRLEATFDRLSADKRGGLVTYVTAGDPDLESTPAILRALDEAGADVIEVGVPFSDPIADGPAIQRASERAIAAGTHLSGVLDVVRVSRSEIRAPLVLFTYLNPVMRMGVETFAGRAAAAGVDAVLLLDLPIEEAETTHAILGRRALDQIFLLSPTTTEPRLREAARLGRGFLYAISRLGVTGARAAVADSARPLVSRIREVTKLPIALGFGISRPEHVVDVLAFADAAVVGSALVQVIGEASASGRDVPGAVRDFVRWLRPAGQDGRERHS